LKKTLRLLLVEDSENDAVLLLYQLERAYNVVCRRVDSPEKMSAALDEDAWDIVISDNAMPAFHGLAALALMRQKGLAYPFLIVSGSTREEGIAQARATGVDDFIPKSQLSQLPQAVETVLARFKSRQAPGSPPA
jgi:CheY-like chemotaxis protein